MGHEFYQPSVDQDTGTDRIKDTIDNQGLLAIRRECRRDAKTDGNGGRGSDAVCTTKNPRQPRFPAWPFGSCKTGTQTKTFKSLVEDEDDVEDIEVVAGDGKRETDEDGVKDDAEFKNEDCGHLSCEMVIV